MGTVASLNSSGNLTCDAITEGSSVAFQCTSVGANVGEVLEFGPVTGLVAYWKLDSDAVDYSGNSYDGTANNVTYTTGKKENCGIFNGASSYISVSPFTIFNGDFSICAWIKETDATIERYITGQSSYSFRCGLNTDRKMVCSLNNGAGATDYTFDYIFSLDVWYHITITYNSVSSDLLLYVNGEYEQTLSLETGALVLDLVHNIFLGSNNDGGGWWYGNLDELRIYNQILTEAEIKILYDITGGSSTIKMKSDEVNKKLYLSGQLIET